MTHSWRQPEAAETPDLSTPQSAAAYWDARLRAPGCTDEERAEFARWRDTHPAHAAAFEQLQLVVQELPDLRSRPELRAIRDAALAQTRQRRTRWFARAAAIAALGVGIGLTAYWLRGGDLPALAFLSPQGSSPQSFATAVGARSTVTLDDGSTVILNTQSRVTIDYNRVERHVNLLAGQAWFEVAQDPNRPFIVYAGDRRITAIGTAFDVRVEAKEVRVTLVEGLVAVDRRAIDSTPSSSPPSMPVRTELEPGEQLIVAAGAIEPEVRQANVHHVTSWREGFVEFEDAPLSEFVAEMNRYSAIQIVLADEEMGDLRLGGRFRTGQVSTFVEALRENYPIEERHVEEDRIQLEWRR